MGKNKNRMTDMRIFLRFEPGLKWLIVSMLILLSFQVAAQESILTANDNATGNGGSASYSVGQITFKGAEASSGKVTEGVQQPYEILFMTGLEDKTALSLDCIVYPNPASSEVKLKIDRPSFEQLSYQLRNNTGLLIYSMNIESKETTIPIKELPAGVYLLTVMENNINLTTWKVIKK
jgi:hypothetical protein